MAGYIGANTSSVTNNQNAAERRKKFTFTAATTSLTGLNFAPAKIHIFHNGIRLVKDTDYTEAADGKSVTLTNAAQAGDEVVAVTFAQDPASNTDFVSASTGGTFSGDVTMASGTTFDASAGTLFPSAGQVIQKVHHTWNTTQTSSSTSYVDITDSSLSFTPKLSTSRLFITADYSFNPNSGVYYAGGRVQIVHDGTVLDSSSNAYETYYQQTSTSNSGNIYVRQSKIMTVLASSTSARTIKLQMLKFSNIASMNVRFNQGDFYSTIVVEEVAQ